MKLKDMNKKDDGYFELVGKDGKRRMLTDDEAATCLLSICRNDAFRAMVARDEAMNGKEFYRNGITFKRSTR